jgi:hypothetical protein
LVEVEVVVGVAVAFDVVVVVDGVVATVVVGVGVVVVVVLLGVVVVVFVVGGVVVVLVLGVAVVVVVVLAVGVELEPSRSTPSSAATASSLASLRSGSETAESWLALFAQAALDQATEAHAALDQAAEAHAALDQAALDQAAVDQAALDQAAALVAMPSQLGFAVAAVFHAVALKIVVPFGSVVRYWSRPAFGFGGLKTCAVAGMLSSPTPSEPG